MGSHQIDQLSQTRRAEHLTLTGTIDAVRLAGAGVAMRARRWLNGLRGEVNGQGKAEVTTLSQLAPRHAHRRPTATRHLAITAEAATRVARAAAHPKPLPHSTPTPVPGAEGEPPRRRPPWIARATAPALGALLAATLVLTALLPGDLRPTRTGPQARATAVPPTPTATAVPTIGALPGFAIYADPKSTFTLQYPASWMASPKDSGVEFYTADTQQTEYVVDVLPEAGASTSTTTGDPTEALQWVNMALQGVQQQESVQNFLRVTGPLPAVTIGGQTWQSGTAVFDVQQLHSRVQVYATIFEGKPYVITLLAPDASFTAGDHLYFRTMLATFKFIDLTPPS
ncbi:MAG TPA: hypothetical protein VGR57_11225 [Ktedonobacterales bacterium]|nr:hypothetical protein [Ktedonobacterales bacterium]